MLVDNVFAAFCAAESTDEKNPPEPGLDAAFSGVGVNGAEVILDNLLGPNALVPDLTRRCDIMFPEGEVTTFELVTAGGGSETPRSRADAECSPSVGVGGVFTIRGAVLSPEGGVIGRTFVSSLLGTLVDFGLSCVMVAGRINSLPGKIAPILDATLPRRATCGSLLSSLGVPAPLPPPFVTFRSGLTFDSRRGVNASRNLLAGDGDLFVEPPEAGCREAGVRDDEVWGKAVVGVCKGNVADLVPSSCSSDCVPSGTDSALTRGEDVVR
jgi:hypothetical protein